jgi:hypothetical protein
MTTVRRIVSSLFATIILLPSLASASQDTELATIQTLLGLELPAELKQYTHLSNGYRCNPWRFLRTPKQVIVEHQEALLSGDINRAMCDYAPNARVLTADGVNIGRDAILQGFLAMANLFGGVMPTTTGLHHTGEVVMVNWEVYTPGMSIPDGVDTFVIRFGQIYYQTVHARVQFGN